MKGCLWFSLVLKLRNQGHEIEYLETLFSPWLETNFPNAEIAHWIQEESLQAFGKVAVAEGNERIVFLGKSLQTLYQAQNALVEKDTVLGADVFWRHGREFAKCKPGQVKVGVVLIGLHKIKLKKNMWANQAILPRSIFMDDLWKGLELFDVFYLYFGQVQMHLFLFLSHLQLIVFIKEIHQSLLSYFKGRQSDYKAAIGFFV